MTTVDEFTAEFEDLASKERCLSPPSHRRPDAFHEARSELARAIAAVASKLKCC